MISKNYFLISILYVFFACGHKYISISFIDSFKINNIEAEIDNDQITINLPCGTSLLNLTPIIELNSRNAESIEPSSGIAQNFSNELKYTVTANNGKTFDYYVNVSANCRTKDVYSFSADDVSFKMIYVEGGLTTVVGLNNEDAQCDAGQIMVPSAFWIAETETTYELWNKVKTWATSNGYTFANVGTIGSSNTGTALQAVTSINWRDAMLFTNALTEWYNAKNNTNYTLTYFTDISYSTPIRQVTNEATVCITWGCQDNPYVNINATGFRLLYNKEWELAARYKGSDSSDSAIEKPADSGKYWTKGDYASGATNNIYDSNACDLVAWFYGPGGADLGNSSNSTKAVKQKQANSLGLYDISGNASEFCFDLYSKAGNNDCPIDNSKRCRSSRGGNAGSIRWYLQNYLVTPRWPHLTSNFIGFRIGRTHR